MAATSSKKDTGTSSRKRPLPEVKEPQEIAPWLSPSLYRLTDGLPRRELKLMVSEAIESEEALLNDIQDLQEALENPDATPKPSVEAMLESEITPLDRYFTISALLGRLRDDLATPLPPDSALPALRAKSGLAQPPSKKEKKDNSATANKDGATASASDTASGADKKEDANTPLGKQKRLLALEKNPEYAKEHAQPAALMALYKKISTHRSSAVFRRPVNPKEAPGYAERIVFPMDLTLVREMIAARQIKSYAQLHQRIGLICHNCVKYNGRESDYAVVTREFESNVDDLIVSSVETAAEISKQQAAKTAAAPSTAKPTSTASTDLGATSASTKPSGTEPATKAAPKSEPSASGDANAARATSKSPAPNATTGSSK